MTHIYQKEDAIFYTMPPGTVVCYGQITGLLYNHNNEPEYIIDDGYPVPENRVIMKVPSINLPATPRPRAKFAVGWRVYVDGITLATITERHFDGYWYYRHSEQSHPEMIFHEDRISTFQQQPNITSPAPAAESQQPEAAYAVGDIVDWKFDEGKTITVTIEDVKMIDGCWRYKHDGYKQLGWDDYNIGSYDLVFNFTPAQPESTQSSLRYADGEEVRRDDVVSCCVDHGWVSAEECQVILIDSNDKTNIHVIEIIDGEYEGSGWVPITDCTLIHRADSKPEAGQADATWFNVGDHIEFRVDNVLRDGEIINIDHQEKTLEVLQRAGDIGAKHNIRFNQVISPF